MKNNRLISINRSIRLINYCLLTVSLCCVSLLFPSTVYALQIDDTSEIHYIWKYVVGERIDNKGYFDAKVDKNTSTCFMGEPQIKKSHNTSLIEYFDCYYRDSNTYKNEWGNIYSRNGNVEITGYAGREGTVDLEFEVPYNYLIGGQDQYVRIPRITIIIYDGDYTVKLNANGGTSPSTVHNVTYGETYGYLSTLPVPTRTGYTFAGWFTKKSGGTHVTDETVFSDSNAIKNKTTVTLYAHWTPITYTIEYQPGGERVTDLPSTQAKTYGANLTLSETVPSRANNTGNYTVSLNANGGSVSNTILNSAITTSYSFKNWNTVENGTGISYNPGDNYTNDENLILYAQWSRRTTAEAVELPVPTRDGYSFMYWSAGTSIDSGFTGSYIPDGNVTLYAVWELNAYTITYNPNGGNNAPMVQRKKPGEVLTLSSASPVRNGWYFIGWAETAIETEAIYRPGDSFIKDADTTLYAVWLQPDFVLPDALTIIGEGAFANCAFNFVELSENTDEIEKDAFSDCNNMRYIYIPDSCAWINRDAFSGVSGLTILGTAGKYAELYANQKGFSFIPVARIR